MSSRGAGIASPAALLRAAPRLASVLDVLRRHGFADLLKGRTRWPEPEDVRQALEELGPVFVKFGQVLSTRGDLVQERYVVALQALQDRTAPLPAKEVRTVIRKELKGEPHDLFAAFDDQQLASASMAQVHAAELHDGRDVVVKVRRPGLEDRVTDDILMLSQLAVFLDLTVGRLRPFDLPALVRDFQRSLQEEMDFRHEARNIRRFRSSLADEQELWIPSVIDALSTSGVLTLERSHGVRIETYLSSHPDEAGALARRLGGLFVRQVFRDGLFHADPHPGNLFVMPEGVVCLHDFGMVGEISEPMREALVDLVEATVAGDARGATNAYLDLGLVPRDVVRQRLEADVEKIVLELRSQPLAEVSVGRALESLGRVGGRYRIRNPGTLMLLARAFVTLEGVLARLDPGISFIEMFAPAFTDSVKQRLVPSRLRRDAMVAARSFDRLVREAPGEVQRILRRWDEGNLGRVTIVSDSTESEAHERTARWQRQVTAGGLLAVAGAILVVGAVGWLSVAGMFLLGAGIVVSLVGIGRG